METKKRDLEQEVIDRVKAELFPVDTEALYREMLNDCCEPFMGTYEPARTLEEVDPTAYRCGLHDYVDSISRNRWYEEIDEDLYDADEVKEIREKIEAEIEEEEAREEEEEEEEEE